MSNFGAKLAELLERKRMMQSELSRLSGIDDTIISRWVTGRQRSVSADDLEKLCLQVSSSPRERAELVRAHLFDELPAVGAELIEISIRGKAASSDLVPDYRATLPLPIQRALETLGREAVTDSDVRSIIISLADMLAKSRQSALQLNEPISSGSGRQEAVDDAAAVLDKVTYSKKKPKKPKSAHSP